MVPSLRKRVWYQRYLGTDKVDVTSYRVLFRKCYTDSSKRPYAEQGGSSGKRNTSKKNWERHTRRSDSHDSESSSSGLSDDEIRNREIKMEVDDLEERPKKNVLPLLDSESKYQGRMLMREWLEVNANVGCMSGLRWLDKDLGLVQIAWKHGSRAGWNRSDVEVFESWALHTGKFNPNKSDCKRWKANFRCALNSLPDVMEIKEKCNTRSRNPYKVYRLLPQHNVTKQSKLKKVKSSDRYTIPHLSACSDDSNVHIKEEPVDQEISALPKQQIWQPIESTDDTEASETKVHEEARIWNTVETPSRKDLVFDHLGFPSPAHSTDAPQTQETLTQLPLSGENSIRHIDHSYANVLEHLNEEQITLEEPDLTDGHDLVSTINEELAKFCSSSFGVDFWSDEAGITTTKFILQDVIDSNDFDGIFL